MNHHQHLNVAERLSTLLDDQFHIGPWKFGLDPIVGLVPVIGDIFPFVISLYILWIGRHMGAPDRLQHKMLFNAVADVVVGMIPVLGDISDFVWKANDRNIKLLRKFLAEQPLEGQIVAENQIAIQT